MAKLKFNVSDSDPAKATGSNFDPPPAGTYQARIDELTVGQSRNGKEMLTVVYEITDGKHKGKKVWDRIVTEVAWKLDQFLQAVGVATARKRKGEVDLEDLVGERVTMTVRQGEYNGNPTAEVARVVAPADEDDLDDDDEDLEEDEDLDEDDEDLEDEDDEEYDEEDEDEEEVDEDDEAEDDYETWSVAELRQELKDRELNAKGAKPALIARLRDDDESA